MHKDHTFKHGLHSRARIFCGASETVFIYSTRFLTGTEFSVEYFIEIQRTSLHVREYLARSVLCKKLTLLLLFHSIYSLSIENVEYMVLFVTYFAFLCFMFQEFEVCWVGVIKCLIQLFLHLLLIQHRIKNIKIYTCNICYFQINDSIVFL